MNVQQEILQVTIKLDNTEKKLAILINLMKLKFQEKLKDKGSIYRVNSKQVRARDVQLIFADTATGARSSGIVSQKDFTNNWFSLKKKNNS